MNTRAWIPHGQSPLKLRQILPVLLLFCGICGLIRYLPARQQACQSAGHRIRLTGSVRSVTKTGSGCQAVIRQANGVRVLLSCRQLLEAGSVIRVTAQAEKPEGPRNPGGFNEAAWLAAQGIFLKARPVFGCSLQVTRRPGKFAPVWLAAQARRILAAALRRLLSPGSADLLAALLLGDTSGLENTERLDFRKAGLAHLTAVSGMHLACLLLPLGRLLRFSRLSAAARYRLLFVFLLFFGCLTGWRVSVFRAVVMTALPLWGRQILRRTEPLYALVIAALLLLLLNPFAIFDSGFWMSFSATAALLRVSGPLAEKLHRLCPRLPAVFCRLTAMALSAQLAAAPWSMRTGGEFFLIGVAVNLPAGALTGLILWLGLAVLPVGLIAVLLPLPDLNLTWLVWPLDRLLCLLQQLAGTAARIRAGRFYACLLNPPWVLLLLCLAVWCLGRLGLFRMRRTWLKPLAWLSAGLLLAGTAWYLARHLTAPPATAWFFDVGQGDSILIVGRDGYSVLIDGGKTGQGLSTLMPALDALGISRVDLAVATHAHDDHIGGLTELLDYGRIRRLVLPRVLLETAQNQDLAALDSESAGLETLLLEADDHGCRVQGVETHDTMTLGRQIRLTVLAPADEETVNRAALADGNAWSLILLADLAGNRLLLTADCTPETERLLVSRQAWPQAAVLKVAHHGSSQTTETTLLEQVRPLAAVISVGYNQYGHPGQAVLARLSDAGCRVYRTDQSGAVQIDFTDGQLVIRTLVTQ